MVSIGAGMFSGRGASGAGLSRRNVSVVVVIQKLRPYSIIWPAKLSKIRSIARGRLEPIPEKSSALEAAAPSAALARPEVEARQQQPPVAPAQFPRAHDYRY